jgi:hypothetical protein
MPRWVWLSLTSLVAILALASLAPAAPVNYQESVSGDLPQVQPFHVFTLDNGVNTISGTIGFLSYTGGGTGFFDFDPFSLVVPTDLAVTSASLSVPSITGNMMSAQWNLIPGLDDHGTVQERFLVNTPGSYTATTTPLPAGSFTVVHYSMTGLSNVTNTANYTFTFNVAAAPEPASLGLLALATLSLPRPRRRPSA